ncbi:ABC transporter substrate-binding protein [Natrarchaeobius halalkaliphilus]|uniref:ABC transporter substrate-binding protein n=1 Tax=Natrarchaeobius halalkaliphilus TaxID=1679091 RepID=A0A3N6M8I5_9EURY|nr:ABC transporter substrate-binding protein [Natrarchaeobius halalkaliphilus]RQG89776.1 ABC transporter substrate-binding protein [Natrarchaeobius halalkaliphilus]
MDEGASSTTRRDLLAGTGVGISSAFAGCSEVFWSRAENAGPDQIELDIKTVPADDDPFAAMILSQLRENFQAAGIDVAHVPSAKADLHREVLLERDYDVFVVRHPGFDDYDALYGLLHSQFVSERGWQNPFQFSDRTVDELLEEQRSAENRRRDVLSELVEFLEETAPYTVVAFPERTGGTRRETDASVPPHDPYEYVDLMAREPADGPRENPIAVGVSGEALANRLNPVVVDRNRIPGLLDLLYDPLVRNPHTEEYVPWLAESVSWHEADQLRATVTLRDGATWHDETPLTADDVVFTNRFLNDTALGDVEGHIPAQRFRSRQTLVSEIERLDASTVRFSFGNTVTDPETYPNRSVAVRALTVPLLPEHIWDARSEVIAERQTDALVSDNEEPVGSGLFSIDDVTSDQVDLQPFDEHVLREQSADRPAVFDGFSQYTGIQFRIDPNPGAMVDALREGMTDVTATTLPSDQIETVQNDDGTRLLTGQTPAFYMVGYNHQRTPLGNHRFRQILSRLVDRDYVVEEFFDGFAEPATTKRSLLGIFEDDREDDTTSTVATFPGTDGEIDVEEVRSLFEAAGYHYEEERLLE